MKQVFFEKKLSEKDNEAFLKDKSLAKTEIGNVIGKRSLPNFFLKKKERKLVLS